MVDENSNYLSMGPFVDFKNIRKTFVEDGLIKQ